MKTLIELADEYAQTLPVFLKDGSTRSEARAALVERIEALEEYVRKLQDANTPELVELRCRIEALEKDAVRWRWLREKNADLDAGFYVGDETDALPEDVTWVGSDLDSSIDAAMKGETP